MVKFSSTRLGTSGWETPPPTVLWIWVVKLPNGQSPWTLWRVQALHSTRRTLTFLSASVTAGPKGPNAVPRGPGSGHNPSPLSSLGHQGACPSAVHWHSRWQSHAGASLAAPWMPQGVLHCTGAGAELQGPPLPALIRQWCRGRGLCWSIFPSIRGATAAERG